MRTDTFEGQCGCGDIRYRMTSRPLFVHCCHCSWCQRESGAAFALNAMIETARLELLQGEPIMVDTPSNSGKGQRIARCPRCHVALWSHYAGAGQAIAFVRVGTLREPARCPPDIHIFASTRQPWLQLGDGIPVMQEYYERADHWPAASLARREALLSARPTQGSSMPPS
ncbi:MAG: GFA family protein [Pseudomonadota bacterium]|jgi:hypothetical protein|nr:GFA family protein [Xanthomonadaceae bacterium]MDE2248492.1 GFA family protein [Xanthomonadaceae bacterium]MDE3209125.1 GFA family protein [Pseudomonadota bacterium]